MYHHAPMWYTLDMPTTRPRFQVTVTDDLEKALDVGCRRWPHLPMSRVLVLLALHGAEQLDSPVERRLALVQALASLPPQVGAAYRGAAVDTSWGDWPE